MSKIIILLFWFRKFENRTQNWRKNGNWRLKWRKFGKCYPPAPPLILVGNNGVFLTDKKLQVCPKNHWICKFSCTRWKDRACRKIPESNKRFPALSNYSQVRSWFGLVHQAEHYSQLIVTIEPFRHLVSPKSKFE